MHAPLSPARTPRPSISLILATIGIDHRLAKLLESLRAQTLRDFETIVIDQSDGHDVEMLIDEHRDALAIRHLRHPRGLSRSRNAGLRIATGAIVAFPDDDCWYDADVLARVQQFLALHPRVDGVTGRALFDAKEHAPARFARRAQWVVPAKVWTQGISCTIFLRRALVMRIGPFDERLGLGADSSWTAAEESDYLLRAVGSHAHIWYDPALNVHHPGHQGRFTEVEHARGSSYARAMGYVMRRHGAGVSSMAYHLARPVGGALAGVLRGRTDVARFHACVLLGRLRGWRDGAAAIEATREPARDDVAAVAASEYP